WNDAPTERTTCPVFAVLRELSSRPGGRARTAPGLRRCSLRSRYGSSPLQPAYHEDHQRMIVVRARGRRGRWQFGEYRFPHPADVGTFEEDPVARGDFETALNNTNEVQL